MKIIEILINGLNVGAIYAMIALGYTMVYGIAKMLNFAHNPLFVRSFLFVLLQFFLYLIFFEKKYAIFIV